MPGPLQPLIDRLRLMTTSQKVTMGVMVLLAIALPVFLIVTQLQTANRSKAAAATVMYLQAPAGDEKKVGEEFAFDIVVDPGSNLLSAIKLDITYDSSKLSFEKPEDLQMSTDWKGMFLEGPTKVSDGKITATMSVGAAPEAVIQTKTKIATLKMKAIGPTQGKSEAVSLGSATAAYSINAEDQFNENVVSQKVSTPIAISGSSLSMNIFKPDDLEPRTIVGKYIDGAGKELRLTRLRVFLGTENGGIGQFSVEKPAWKFSNLSPGTKYTITVDQIPGYKMAIAHCAQCTADSANFTDGNTVTVDVAADRATQIAVRFLVDESYLPPIGNRILGRYVDSAGNPMSPANPRVLVTEANKESGFASTGSPNWEFLRLSTGTYKVTVDPIPGYRVVTVKCRRNDDCVNPISLNSRVGSRTVNVRVDERRNTEVLVTLMSGTSRITPSPTPTKSVTPTAVDACNACAADVDGDGQVTNQDYARILACINSKGNANSCDSVNVMTLDDTSTKKQNHWDLNCIQRITGATCKK